MIDYIILGIILLYCVFILIRQFKYKKNSCSHDCSTCGSTSCSIDYKKMFEEIKEKELKQDETH